MVANKASRLCWAYQAAAGTEAIDDATDTTYFFGKYNEDCDDWKLPFVTQQTQSYGSYAVRTKSLVANKRKYDTFRISFLPMTAQFLAWFLKQPTDADPDTIVALETGLPLPLTIRYELLEGTVPRLVQSVDSYCIGMYARAMRNTPFIVETEWAYGRLEDDRGQWIFDDTCSAVNVGAKTITLTDDADRDADSLAGFLVYVNDGDHEDAEYTIANNTDADPTVLTISESPGANLAADTLSIWDKKRPMLTTSPTEPGNDTTNIKYVYDGRPSVTWDDGGEDIALNECWSAEWNQAQEWQGVLDSDSKYQTVYLYQYFPVNIILKCIFETEKQWHDYIDKRIKNLEIKVYKADMTNYISVVFTNCHIEAVAESGISYKGLYEAIITLKAEKQEATFTFESTDTWATHFKHVA